MKTIKQKYFSTLFNLYFFLHHTIISINGSSNYLSNYTPTDNILLDCGSPKDSNTQDGRFWSTDIHSKFSPSEQSDITQAVSPLPPSVENVPYMTARISRSPFTYTFPITAGQKFIRLYFYPASYLGFEKSLAFFSVKAGPFTLLNNFSADSSDSESFFKEFCLNVQDNQHLNITFAPSTPSTPTSTDVYAFINGIEIVSTPADLYYTSLGNGIGKRLLGQNSLFSIDNNTVLEMLYRLNVGGSFLSPVRDSGMFRTWYNDEENLLKPRVGVLPVNPGATIKYTPDTPPYIAPEDVYRTARSMGTEKMENERYNLTWILPVDFGFKYLVRLHFCEIEPEMMVPLSRVFRIYINNQTAEDSADIISWSGGNKIPVYRDYVVWVEGEGIEGKRDLFVALHPQIESRTHHSDAILNGLEMFKINNSDGNLAAPNHKNHVNIQPHSTPAAEKSKMNKIMSFAVAGSVIVVLAIFVVLFYAFFWRLRKAKKDHGGLSSRTKASSLPEELCRQFSLSEIQTATNFFDRASIIGVGGFGNVYKGHIDSVDTVVAIKRLNPASRQGAHEFKTEIEMLSQLRHLHLVSLIGYCNDEREMILVYEYMINGTLRDHLYETDNDPLPWKQRLEICIGAAKGLHYLHTGAKSTIIHRDVKSTNILLDEKWVAKVSDFGLSKMGPTSVPNTAVSTCVKGTWGYLDPEYIKRQQLTEKSDVYSFGVLLFEVLCARKAVDHKLEEDEVSLAHWVQACIQNRTLYQIIDPYLMGTISLVCLKKFVTIAESCLHENGIDRPTMGDVVESLEFALQLQESGDAMNKDMNDEYIYERISLSAAIPSAHKEGQGGRPLDSSTSAGFTTGTSGLSFRSSDSDDSSKSGELSLATLPNANPNEQ